jgi:peptidoglycan biosynthesis protein MviN/MurJ (putative lipid II flippase)
MKIPRITMQQKPPKIAQPLTNRSSGRPAMLVATGIMFSRVAGLVRERALAHFLGTLPAADAFRAALRIPNFLQNLFGEGVLSASFIPVYSRLLASSDEREANHVASVVGSLLAVVTSVLVVLGVFSTPLLIDAIAPGFTGETRQLTIRLVQILFPGVGLLVMSAWCLGVLNSHCRFRIPRRSFGTCSSLPDLSCSAAQNHCRTWSYRRHGVQCLGAWLSFLSKYRQSCG